MATILKLMVLLTSQLVSGLHLTHVSYNPLQIVQLQATLAHCNSFLQWQSVNHLHGQTPQYCGTFNIYRTGTFCLAFKVRGLCLQNKKVIFYVDNISILQWI